MGCPSYFGDFRDERDREFFNGLSGFRKVYIDTPLSRKDVETVNFSITPQPVFNKNFDLLSTDISTKMENGYKVLIYCEKESQSERLRSILSRTGGLFPEFVIGKNITSQPNFSYSCVLSLVQAVTISVGTSLAVFTMLLSSGVLSLESQIIRMGFRAF